MRFDKTYSSTPSMHTTKILQAIMVKHKLHRLAFDIKQAYCQADMPEGQQRDNQSRNPGSNTQMQQDAHARPLLHLSPIEDNPEEQQAQCIGVVETAAEQDRTGVLIKTKKKNQNQEQEDRECDARAAPCQEDAEQDLHAGKTGGDLPQEQEEGDSPREDRARAHARARQATQVPRLVSRPTLSAAAARYCLQTETGQTETGQAETIQGGGQRKKLLERPQVPSRDSYLEKMKMSPPVGATQAAAARSSPGREDSSVIEGSLKTHQAAPGEGKSVHLNMNVSSLSRQSVDLQTVDRLHVSGAAAGGGDAVNVHSKGLNSTVGLNSTGVIPAVVLQPSREDIRESGQPFVVEAGSAIRSHLSHTPAKTPVNTAGSTVDHSERQVLQQQQQHSTAQCHVPLTQGGPARTSGGGDAVGVQQLQQHSTVQNSTDLTDHGRQTVSGRPKVGERQSDQNLLPVSPLGDAEYDAHLRLSAEQRVQLIQ